MVIRDVFRGAIHFARPVTVIEDAARGLLVSQVPGAVGMVTRGYPDDLAAVFEELLTGDPTLVPLTWKWSLTLGVMTPAQWWTTRLFWSADTGDFMGYYVDFVRPMTRDGDIVDTLDLGLDIVVAPEGSWSWKDEDHLSIFRERGYLDDAEPQLEAARLDAVAAIETRSYPFDDSLLALCPTPNANPPVLFAGWDS